MSCQKLHQYIDGAEEEKVKAIYLLLLEEEIKQGEREYTDDFKKDLDHRHAICKKGGKMISESAANKQIGELLKKSKKR